MRSIAGLLNEAVDGFDRWATPSIALGQPRVFDVYGADASAASHGVRVEARDLHLRGGAAIVAALRRAEELDRWCAPSVFLDQPRVVDAYRVDVSISASGIGAAS